MAAEYAGTPLHGTQKYLHAALAAAETNGTQLQGIASDRHAATGQLQLPPLC